MGNEYRTDLDSANDLVNARQTVLRVSIRRPDDLFVADLTFYNLKITGSPPVLTRIEPGHVAIVVMQLPPQSFGEQALLDATGPEVPVGSDTEFVDAETQKNEAAGITNAVIKNVATPEPGDPLPAIGGLRIRIAGPSRLAFIMPATATSVPYTLAGLLNAIKTWPLAHALAAQPEMQLPLGGVAGDIETLNALVASDDFIGTQRTFMEALHDLAPGSEAAVVAAGKRMADKAALGFASTKPATPLEIAVRSEATTLAAKYSALSDVKSKALVTIAIAYQSAAEMAKLKIAGTAGFQAKPVIPLLPELISPSRPGAQVTALELPYRVQISPIGAARFSHRATAIAHQGRTELWHTRLTRDANDTGRDAPGQFRAIWSEDFLPENVPSDLTKPFRMPLDAQDRKMLVQLMAGFDEFKNEAPTERYRPSPATADRLILSPLGGLLNTDAAWDTRPVGVDLEAWRHSMTMGRDHYVRVVYAGYLLPFGHPASLIKITERKFEPIDSAHKREKRVVALRQRFFIVVRHPLKQFDGSYHEFGGHAFPFTSVELLTHVTPKLVAPDKLVCKVNDAAAIYAATAEHGGLTPRQLFWPMLTESPKLDFRFDIAAIDRAGQLVTFSMPLLFMSDVANTGDVKVGTEMRNRMQMIIDAYNVPATYDRRTVQVGGVSVCFAPPQGDREGDPRFPTDALEFKATPAVPKSNSRINTYPELKSASVGLRAVQRILNKSSGMVAVHYADVYRRRGFIADNPATDNPGEVFLELASAINVDFGPGTTASRTDAVGAVASPAMTIKGLSRRTGLVSDLTNVVKNTFDPVLFFGNAKILGPVTLSDLVRAQKPISGGNAPKFVTRELPASGSTPAQTESRYDWQTQLETPTVPCPIMPSADGSTSSSFGLLAVTTSPVDAPASARSTATATIKNFNVNLFGLIILRFRELTFTAERGKKPAVNVDMHPTQAVRFTGALEFVNELKDLLPGSGFSDPSALQVTASGISAHYALTIPSVQVGIFDVSGLSIGARFTLPFDTAPLEVGFNFGERENPFSITVSLLGGGGFLSIGIGTDGIREVEAALEAGARCAIDLGVASGAVEIKAGIYFHWIAPSNGDDAAIEVSGYVRLHGELDVMGIISASLTFNLQLGFKKQNGRPIIFGEATLTIEIEVLVFSGEVTVRCRREFAGSPGDPTFAQLIPATDTWSTYCLAFGEA